mmetsp:Transcript_74719/g.207751  ORF Transcript_74719/g.207751 Transcript_74719/m.207751 type:complete len:212 (-) Transcript_74719:3-638(-)
MTGAIQVREHFAAAGGAAAIGVACSRSAAPCGAVAIDTAARRALDHAAAQQLHELRGEALKVDAKALLSLQGMEVAFAEHQAVVKKEIRFVGQLKQKVSRVRCVVRPQAHSNRRHEFVSAGGLHMHGNHLGEDDQRRLVVRPLVPMIQLPSGLQADRVQHGEALVRAAHPHSGQVPTKRRSAQTHDNTVLPSRGSAVLEQSGPRSVWAKLA